jgi:uncharacterized membrane protein YkoI
MQIKSTALAVAFIASIFTVSTAYAASGDDSSEVDAMNAATITASDAATTVESQSGGKVVELALVAGTTAPMYQITVLKPDGTEANFTVDAKSGAMVAAKDVGDGNNGATEAEDDDNGGSDAAGDE